MTTINRHWHVGFLELLQAGAALENWAAGKDKRQTRKVRKGADAAYQLAVFWLVDEFGWDEADARELVG